MSERDARCPVCRRGNGALFDQRRRVTRRGVAVHERRVCSACGYRWTVKREPWLSADEAAAMAASARVERGR